MRRSQRPFEDLDLQRAAGNLTEEFRGDWHKDPWGWPEIDFMADEEQAVLVENCKQIGSRGVAQVDVPKENWGTRPAVVTEVRDRLMYQALVDKQSLPLAASLDDNVFGWRMLRQAPVRGVYSSNKLEWEKYRSRLSDLVAMNDVALKTDIVSFFGSISLDVIGEHVEDRCGSTAEAKRLISYLEGSQRPERPGLPQRSHASAVLANGILRPVDDVLRRYSSAPHTFSTPLGGSTVTFLGPGFTRWMDDIWLFLGDPAEARAAQRALQDAARSIGLHLNSAKTDLLEGADVAEQALVIEHSAIDDAIFLSADFAPLEELIDKIIDDPDHVARTSVRFATARLLRNGKRYRERDLLHIAARMPHAADSLARLFRARFRSRVLQDWFLDYVIGPWSSFPWAIAQYGRMFPSDKKPRAEVRDYFCEQMAAPGTELPLLAIASQRMAHWDESECRSIAVDVLRRTDNALARRTLILAARQARASKSQVRTWISAHEDNEATRALLESRGYKVPQERSTYTK